MAVGIWLKIYPSGRKNAVKYADEIIVLSKGVQDYFKETYGRETHFIPNGVNRPQIRETNLITEKFGLKKDSYILFLGRLVPEKGIRYLVEAFKNVKTDKKLVIAGGSSDTDSFMEELKELAKGDNRILFTGFVQGAMLDELYSNKDMNKFVFIYAWISGWCAVCLFCMFQPFMEIWMGCEMLFPMIDVVLICLYFYSLTMGDVRSQYSSAAGLFWENRKYVLVEALSNIVLNYILGKLFGVHGIIAATLISILLINFIWGSAILFKCYFKDYKVGEFYKKHFFYFGVAIIAAILTYSLTTLMRTSCLRAGEVWASILPALEGQTAGCTWTYAKKRAGGGGDANGDHPFCHHCRSGDADRRIDRKFKIQCGHGVQDRGTDPRSAQAQRLCGEDPCDPERHSGAQSQDDRYRNT